MVSRRAAAALVVELLLAARRGPHLGRSRAVGQREAQLRFHGGHRPPLSDRRGGAARTSAPLCFRCLRGRVLLLVEGAAPAVERRSIRLATGGSRRARTPGAYLCAGTGRRRRPRFTRCA